MRLVTRVYDKRTLSAAQPSASAVEEAGRSRASSPSGRLLLRMPPGLHGEVARAAEQQGTSLNGYIIARLTESVGWAEGEAPEQAPSVATNGRTLTWLLVANVVAVSLAGLAALVILLVAL